MKVRYLALVVSVVLTPAVLAQPELPKPGPEHAQLKQLEGTWDATVKMADHESKGTMTYKMDLGGLWLVGDFLGDFGGQKFQGKGLDSYDPMKKKYIGVWFDSMSASPLVLEGTLDKAEKKLTMVGEGPGMDGKMTKYTTVTEYKGKDTMIFTMSTPGKDGKNEVMMTITYKRKS